MKRFSLMAAISALIGSSVSEASPAFKKYKDALAAYKKTPTDDKANAAIAAYDALKGDRQLRGDILARDQYAAIVLGKEKANELKARRKLLKDQKRGVSGAPDKVLQAQVQQLQSDLTAVRTTNATLTAEKKTLQDDARRLQDELNAKTISLTDANAEITRLTSQVTNLEYQANKVAAEGRLNNALVVALNKTNLDDKIAAVADVITQLPAVKELLAIAAGPNGIVKLNIATIADKEVSSVQPLKDLAAALQEKATAAGADYTALVGAIKARAEAIEKAGSAIDWSTVGTDLPLGKLGKVVRIKDAINLIKNQQDLIDYATPVILSIGEAIAIENTLLDDAAIASLTDQDKKDFESFYLDYLDFVKRAIAHADGKSIDKASQGYVMLLELQKGINALLPDLITGGAADGGPKPAPATDPVIVKFDKAAIAAANDQSSLSALVAKISKELESADLTSSNKDARVAAARDFVKDLLQKALVAKVDPTDLGLLKDNFEGNIGEDL